MPPPSGARPDAARLRERLRGGLPLLLDGALGTELERRGARSVLPLWSTHALLEAPELVRAVHAEYAAAGVEILTANTFRTQARTLRRAGMQRRAQELGALAVALAREGAAQAGRACWVAGSAPPLEDCYRPDLVPDEQSLAREHDEHARALAEAGADLILVETINRQREGVAAARAARATGLPFVVSFVCNDAAELLSGEPLGPALDTLCDLSPDAVAVNCLPPRAVHRCLSVLAAQGLPFGVYANLGAPSTDGFTRSDACSPARFAARARGWVEAGARLIGGCCGTTPEHLAAVSEMLARVSLQQGSPSR